MYYPIQSEDTALVVIDAQEEYFDPEGPAYFPESAARLDSINRLIDGFSASDAPVIYIRHAHRPTGVDAGRMGDFDEEGGEDSFLEGSPRVAFHAGLHVIEDATVVSKTRYDSFQGTDLDGILRTLGVRTVVLVGYMSSFCCDTTARAAQSRDYQTVFVVDAVGGPDLVHLDGSPYPSPDVLEDVASALAAGFADVRTTDEVLADLTS